MATRKAQWQKHHARRLIALRAYHEQCPKWKVRDRYLRRQYGISVFQYNEMARAQGYVCTLCGSAPTRLSTDHDHATGRVRGLLCWRCNRGLQVFRDNPTVLAAAAEYLRSEFDGRRVEPSRSVIGKLLIRAERAGGVLHFTGTGNTGLVAITEAVWRHLNGSAKETG